MEHSVFREKSTGEIITTSNPSNYAGEDYEALGKAEEPNDDERWSDESKCFKPCSKLKAARAARRKNDKLRIADLEERVDSLEKKLGALIAKGA